MISGLSALLTRAKDILRTEGLKPLLSRGFDFARRWCFQYGRYYLYEHTLEQRNEADFTPLVPDLQFKIIHTDKEADELAATSGVDIRRRFIHARNSLHKGAIAFCFFVEGEIAHIGWVALSKEAKNTFDYLPYRVNFSNGEACTGGTETIAEYRGKGLMTYGYFKRQQFLREKGMTASRNAVSKGNIASQRAHAKFSPKIYAEARYLKLLWWEFWNEMPLTLSAQSD